MRSWRCRVLMECACGEPFTMQAAEVRKALRRDLRVYCSRVCAEAGQADTQRTRKCVCGVKLRKGQPVYCSPACRRANHKGRKLPDIGCPICGVMFRPTSSRTAYCSRVCANTAHSRRMVGKGNSHYRDGTSYAKLFRSMRPLILERDDGVCAVCGEAPTMTYVRGGAEVTRSQLSIHHLNEVVEDNRPENLITLCQGHHMTHHKSKVTPYPWFETWAIERSTSMTSRWKARVTSLQTAYSSTTASSSTTPPRTS